MAMPWCEFCAVEMLIFIVVCADAAATKPNARLTPANGCERFHAESPPGGRRVRVRSRPRKVVIQLSLCFDRQTGSHPGFAHVVANDDIKQASGCGNDAERASPAMVPGQVQQPG